MAIDPDLIEQVKKHADIVKGSRGFTITGYESEISFRSSGLFTRTLFTEGSPPLSNAILISCLLVEKRAHSGEFPER